MNIELPERVTALDEHSNRLYVAVQDTGVFIYDVSSRVSPLLLSIIDARVVHDVAIQNDFIALAQGYHGVSIWDIADPIEPTLVGFFNSMGNAQDVLMRDTLLYVNDLGSVEILSIASALNTRRSPAAPQHLTARVVGSSLHLFWDEVTTTIYGRPLENVVYKVWATTDPTLPHELYALVRTTTSPVVQLDIANLGSRGQFFVTAE